MDINKGIIEANKELKAAFSTVKITQKSNRLYLRGVLPPKPGQEAKGFHQQHIALGLKATEENLQKAKKEAIAIKLLLQENKFDWSSFSRQNSQKSKTNEKNESITDLTERFSKWYLEKGLADGRRPYAVKDTLKKDYLSVFKKLPANANLTEKVALELMFAVEADSRSRKRYKNALKLLMEFAGISCNFDGVKSSYSVENTAPRNLPSDEEIETYWTILYKTNKQWAYYFGILAAFGLRPQEPFYSSLMLEKEQPFLEVFNNKTGKARVVLPYPSRWINDFSLWKPNLPLVRVPEYWDKNDDYDLSVVPSRIFRDYCIPFPPYNLRHAWAVRTLLMGLDVSLAAKQMGHSVKVHTDTYHYWINKQVQLEAWKKANGLI
jgi:integrase